MAGACLTFAHLFSFQVSYADLPPGSTLPSPPAAAGTKMLMDAASLAMGFVKKKLGGGNDSAGEVVLKRGIFEVDFTAGLLWLADKDKAIASQGFQAFKRKYAGDGDLLISLHFQGSECWDITTQSSAEKRTLNHLLECISRKLPLEQTIEAGKEKGLIGIDKTVIKAGLLSRKAKTAYKMDERFIVLVPGKLLLFKGPDISSKRVRYVTTLTRARVEATHGQPSFQILVPHTKALSLAAASAEAAKEWIFALEDSIEYANSQGAGNQPKRADAGAAQMTQGRRHQYDEGYMIPDSNCLQNLELCDKTAVSSNPLRPAGPSTQQYQSQPAPDQLNRNGLQMYMDEGSYGQDCSGAGSYNGMRVHERRDPSECTRQNQRLMGTNFEANAQDYQVPYLASGFRNERNPNTRNTDSSYGGGPSNIFADPHGMSCGFAPSQDVYERKDANANATRGGYFSQGGELGGPYIDNSYKDPNLYMDPQSNPPRVLMANNPYVEYPNANAQFETSRTPYAHPPATPQNPYNHPLGGGSDGNFYGSQASSQGCPPSGSDGNFYRSQAGSQECPPSGNYRPNANYGGFGSHLNDRTQYNNEGGREVNPHGAYASQTGHQQYSNSHQQYNNTRTPNCNKAAYDPWASRIEPKDSDSD